MNRLIHICVHNPVFVNILLAMVILSGAFAAVSLIREIFPSTSLDMIMVSVPYPGAGPEEVEEGVCLKLEDALEGTEDVKSYYTVGAEDIGMAYLELIEGVDVQSILDEVTNRVNAISTFPADAERPIINEMKFEDSVLWVAVYGDAPRRQLKDLAEQLKDELLREDGISKINIVGAGDYEIAVEISEEKLRQYGLTFDAVAAAVNRAARNFPGGTIRTTHEQIKIRTMGRRYTGAEYADIVLMARPDGTSIRLGQVATIIDDFTEDAQTSRFNGLPCAQLQVNKTDREDALAITAKVDAFIAQKNRELPPNIRLQKWVDTSVFIESRQDLLINNGIIGLALVFCLLWAFLDLRLAFWVSMGIPISLAGGLALMGAMGQTINMVSLFALIMILGIIVDDAIIAGEAIYFHRKSGEGPLDAAIKGATEVAWPVLTAVVTTIVAFVPLLFVGGIMGKFIKVLPIVVIAALATSLFESLMMLPAHLRNLPHIARRSEMPGDGHLHPVKRLRIKLSGLLENIIENQYRPAIATILHWRYAALALGVAVLLLTAGAIGGGFLKYEMFPKTDSDFMVLNIEFANGTPIEGSEAGLERAIAALNSINEDYKKKMGCDMLSGAYTVAGQNIEQEGPENGTHLGAALIEMIPSETREYHYRDIMSEWEKRMGTIPGAQSIDFISMETGPPGKPVEIWLLGNEIATLQRASKDLQAHLASYVGLFQIQDDFKPGKRELRMKLKPEAHTLGLTTADLGNQIRQGFYGDEVMRIQRGRDEVKVWVRYPLAERRSLSDVENVRIRTPLGAEIPLGSVAELSLEQGYSAITRKDGFRRIAVTADVNARKANAQEIIAKVKRDYLPELMAKYPGVFASIEGEKKKTTESFDSLKIGFPLALLGIYLILATMFKSYVTPMVIMVTIPFGLIGAAAGHIVYGWGAAALGVIPDPGFPLTIMSIFGMVALAGIVVNDAIVLIDAVNDRISGGMNVFDALVDGGCRRFRPIMLTTLTTSFGLMPIITETNVQAQFLIPMALTIAAGVLFATLLTLALIPCLLLIVNDARIAGHWLLTRERVTREEIEPINRQVGRGNENGYSG